MKHPHTSDHLNKPLEGEQLEHSTTNPSHSKASCASKAPHSHHHQSPDHAHEHQTNNQHDHDHSHDLEGQSTLQLFFPAIISLFLLLGGLALDQYIPQNWFQDYVRLGWYLLAYLPVGYPVLKEAWQSILAGVVFSEFMLMAIATMGAFLIGEYPEAVAVMLFYAVGEVFQTLAVSRAKANIKSLLDQRPDEVTLLQNGVPRVVGAREVAIGSIIQIKPGELVALDGVLLSHQAQLNTAALTGESVPDNKKQGEVVLAGMINLQSVIQIQVTTAYSDSKLSKILEMVQEATSQKAPTELFIRKFARIYTPIVVVLAVLIALVPYFFVIDYVLKDWVYRALVFLVISCPCALVISIPLGYFGGIGAASRHGILFKGSNYLDALADIQQVVMDKTGTMTEGVFKIQQVNFSQAFNQDTILQYVNLIESNSTHPIATAIHQYVGAVNHQITITDSTEIAGHGLRAMVEGKELLVGNFKLMDRFNIAHTVAVSQLQLTVIAVAYDGKFVGYLTIADQIKMDAALAISQLQKIGVRTLMLSGDKHSVVQYVAQQLGIDEAYGDLLPEDKVAKVQQLKNQQIRVAFVGDGVNDAPVVALSDVGIAMGGLGSDATIETADVVIQDDQPSKIPVAIAIGKKTKQIVWQNISLAFGVKAIVLVLGAGGLATMWEAVFADVGVALLAILNAIRIQRMKF